MVNFSKSETEHIKSTKIQTISHTTATIPSIISSLHGFIHLKHGSTEITASLRLTKENSVFSINYYFPFDIQKYFEELKTNELGVEIEINVLNDDGGILEIVFYAVSALCQNIAVPYDDEIKFLNVNLPSCKSFAKIGDKLILSPNKLEETAAHAIFTGICFDDEIQFTSFCETGLNLENLKDFLDEFDKEEVL